MLAVLLWVDEYYSALAWRSHSIIPNIIRFYVLSENWVFYGNLYAECYSIVIDSSGGSATTVCAKLVDVALLVPSTVSKIRP